MMRFSIIYSLYTTKIPLILQGYFVRMLKSTIF